MDLKVSGFDWDHGNRDKCRKHGLAIADIENALVHAQTWIAGDIRNSGIEDRYIAIGQTSGGRLAFVAFTFREIEGELRIRPISARYMHKKEVEKYEKEIAKIQNR